MFDHILSSLPIPPRFFLLSYLPIFMFFLSSLSLSLKKMRKKNIFSWIYLIFWDDCDQVEAHHHCRWHFFSVPMDVKLTAVQFPTPQPGMFHKDSTSGICPMVQCFFPVFWRWCVKVVTVQTHLLGTGWKPPFYKWKLCWISCICTMPLE